MTDRDRLRGVLTDIDGSGYGAYKRLSGTTWTLAGAPMRVERVQADPFAPPSRLVIEVPGALAAVPEDLIRTEPRRRATADHLLRLLADALGAGRSGSSFRVDAGGQEVLARSACEVAPAGVVARIGIALPAKGRRIRGREAARLLADDLPAAVAAALRFDAIDVDAARRAAEVVEDAVALRDGLRARGLVAFVGDGSILPRRSGIDERPMAAGSAVPFAAPESLRVTLDTPNAGAVTGMGIAEGVTLIVGGGFHGKSTLLRALERGVYDHVPGDGRERVVARPDAVKVRAEDGRPVARVDVSTFVGDLPTGADTRDFSTANASGSTSQAAAIMESLEVGADAILVDEDTSATNLMVRDARMRSLVPDASEPLTPFVDLVRALYRERGVSTVLVAGGSGDYLGVADCVVHMDRFRAHDVTDRAHVIAGTDGLVPAAAFPAPAARVPDPASIDPRVRGKAKLQAHGTDALRFGDATIDLGAVEQLVDRSQAVGVGLGLRRLAEDGFLDGKASLAEALETLEREVLTAGPAALAEGYPGDFALPRRQEVAAALNRLRGLVVRALRDDPA